MADGAGHATTHAGEEAVGRFVRTRALGTGRLADVGPNGARVRYFQGPGRAPYVEHVHERTEVSIASIPTHTRAYLHDGRRWRIGRVDGAHPQDPNRFVIAFPNAEGAVLASESFDVRWSLPIANPFDVLEAVGGDSPVVYEARLGLLAEWSRQRAAATGVEGLLLGSVELHPHQLAVVRRVAADPVQRYLLADEVGLGKTIEAGALISQFLASRPSSRVLVLAPDYLRKQWAAELLDRFRTDQYSDAWLRIRSHTDPESWPAEPVDLLVIDEAHHVTRVGTLPQGDREGIAALAHAAEALLLLSATPVRSNEAGFLDLLHLLDPQHYQPDQVEDFTRRVELRDQLALTYQSLMPDIDEFDLSLYADELANLFPTDTALHDLARAAVAADDVTRPAAVIRVREHLSETYRLHHRLVRTRRTAQVGATFRVRGRTRARPFTLEVADDTDRLRSQLLDSVRLHMTAAIEQGDIEPSVALDVFRDVAARCGSLPHALVPLIEPLSQVPEQWREALEHVGSHVLDGWRQLIDNISTAGETVATELSKILSRASVARGTSRTVVMSAFTEGARAAAAELSRRWGDDRVAAHLTTNSRDDNAAEIARWADEGPCSVLVCDASAEEGINLQAADLLIHVDLPWEAFRVEQRIGRCDRHAASTLGPIPSAVVTFGTQQYASAWFEFLADGCNVFSESVSSLQYVLSDTERGVHTAALAEGPYVLSDAIEQQAATLASERTRIVAHDALDSLDATTGSGHNDADADLLASDGSSLLTDSLVTWLEGVGANVRSVAPGVIRLGRKPRPQVEFELELAMASSREQPLASRRSSAVERAIPVLRSGHALVDAVASYLSHSDRGVAFALFRPARGQWPPVVVLRTDYLISVPATESLVATAEALGLAPWLRQVLRELVPPVVETVIMTGDGAEVTHLALRQPYDKQRGDRNLSSRPDLFDRLTAHIDWSATCAAAMQSSGEILGRRASMTERPRDGARSLRERIEHRIDRERSRGLAGLPNSGLELRKVLEATPDQFDPDVQVLGCGVLFVGDAKRLG
jgi:ATP-dependent helicase HepA